MKETLSSKRSPIGPSRRVEVVPNQDDLVQVASEMVTAAAAISIAQRGAFRLALAGGSTPTPLYERLAVDPDVDWRRWHLFWSDERCVPPEHADSNYHMVQEALLDRLKIKPGLVVRMAGELPPEIAALQYEQSVLELVPAKFAPSHALTSKAPRFDLILLGMGADGHTASLFPGTEALTEEEHLVVSNPAPQSGGTRLTFTFPLINAARRALFLVSGNDKAETLRDVLTGPHQPAHFPCQGVHLLDGQLTWLVDEAAFALVEAATAS
jgi:6-phosphogluconolactonase